MKLSLVIKAATLTAALFAFSCGIDYRQADEKVTLHSRTLDQIALDLVGKWIPGSDGCVSIGDINGRGVYEFFADGTYKIYDEYFHTDACTEIKEIFDFSDGTYEVVALADGQAYGEKEGTVQPTALEGAYLIRFNDSKLESAIEAVVYQDQANKMHIRRGLDKDPTTGGYLLNLDNHFKKQ